MTDFEHEYQRIERSITASQPSEEQHRQELLDEQKAGDWLGWVILFLFGFAVLAFALWVGSHLAQSIDLSGLALHPDCPTRAC